MKIEKINDNQIKCTLNKSDLASRQIKLSELAYGTEKAKDLFRDMMQQANMEFGFDAEDIPLMIEAIPLSADCIVLVITKVEDPEELDVRFSRFAPSFDENDDGEPIEEDPSGNMATDLLDMLGQLKNKVAEAKDSIIPLPDVLKKNEEKKEKSLKEKKDDKSSVTALPLFKIYSFDSLNTVIKISGILDGIYKGANALYKSPKTGRFYLVAYKSSHSLEEFSAICCIFSEYGNNENSSPASEAFIKEHFIKIIPKRAIQKLQSV